MRLAVESLAAEVGVLESRLHGRLAAAAAARDDDDPAGRPPLALSGRPAPGAVVPEEELAAAAAATEQDPAAEDELEAHDGGGGGGAGSPGLARMWSAESHARGLGLFSAPGLDPGLPSTPAPRPVAGPAGGDRAGLPPPQPPPPPGGRAEAGGATGAWCAELADDAASPPAARVSEVMLLQVRAAARARVEPNSRCSTCGLCGLPSSLPPGFYRPCTEQAA
jgi:hypothetical protein